MKELIFLLQADADIQAAFERYENYQGRRGLVFLRRLDAALELLKRLPEIGPPFLRPYRRLLIRDFPFGIFYEVNPTRIIVVGVMDLRQNPRTIRKKLRGN